MKRHEAFIEALCSTVHVRQLVDLDPDPLRFGLFHRILQLLLDNIYITCYQFVFKLPLQLRYLLNSLLTIRSHLVILVIMDLPS